MIREKRWYVWIVLIIITLLWLIDKHNSLSKRPDLQHKQNLNTIPALTANWSEKWIVITTIAYPTNAVIALAAENGWRIVIVADTKTPEDWNHTNCDFLSIKRQKELGYSISRLTPFKSYTRKMIGYLYAIQNGAQWIYDTDDDNQPVDKGLEQFDTASITFGLAYGLQNQRNERNLFNPYEFWGQPSIWPRGYPLEDVKTGNDESAFRLCKISKRPIIQQGLVTKDPDVDALYRLLHADAKDGLDVTFNQHAPSIALNSGTFCPFNSQNTFFHRDAFWALFLPISVAFRVTDIWRGYYAQKLLHLIGHRLGFYPANAVQKRNSHSYLADFEDEASLYSDAGRLVDFLTNWTCSFLTLPECMIKLSADFVEQGFWKASDLELTEAWISDLKALEYIFPSVLFNETSLVKNYIDESINMYQSENCRSTFLTFPSEKNDEREILFWSYRENIKDWCNEALPIEKALTYRFDERSYFSKTIWRKLQKIALIVSGNYPLGPSISLLQRLYQPYFAAVIFCGTIYHENFAKTDGYPKLIRFSYINVTEDEINKGYRAYICTSKAIELKLQSVNGYITIADDTAYNFYNDIDFRRFRSGRTLRPETVWWQTEWGGPAMKRAITIIKDRIKSNHNSPLAKVMQQFSTAINGSDVYSLLSEPNMHSLSDFYYLPKENETFFYEMANVFFEAQLFHEIALPKIGAGLEWFRFYNSTWKDLSPSRYLWQERPVWEKRYSKDLIFLHPIKLSAVKDLEQRRKYCDLIIRNYFESISIDSPATTAPSEISTTSKNAANMSSIAV